MPIINFSNPITIFLAIILFVLVLVLGKETHKSAIVAIMLFTFIGLLVGHAIEFFVLDSMSAVLYKEIVYSMTADFIFVFLSFISYLWIDDIQAKIEKKRSIDNSLNWFWKEI